jgi:hypothetical protein
LPGVYTGRGFPPLSPAWAPSDSAAGTGVKYTLPRFASCCYRSSCA